MPKSKSQVKKLRSLTLHSVVIYWGNKELFTNMSKEGSLPLSTCINSTFVEMSLTTICTRTSQLLNLGFVMKNWNWSYYEKKKNAILHIEWRLHIGDPASNIFVYLLCAYGTWSTTLVILMSLLYHLYKLWAFFLRTGCLATSFLVDSFMYNHATRRYHRMFFSEAVLITTPFFLKCKNDEALASCKTCSGYFRRQDTYMVCCVQKWLLFPMQLRNTFKLKCEKKNCGISAMRIWFYCANKTDTRRDF